MSVKPVIIFIDEIDSLATERGDNESSSNRCALTELLVQFSSVKNENLDVIVICATNRPFDIDSALMRRFTTKIHIEPPGFDERILLMKKKLKGFHTIKESEFKTLAKLSENFSSDDVIR